MLTEDFKMSEEPELVETRQLLQLALEASGDRLWEAKVGGGGAVTSPADGVVRVVRRDGALVATGPWRQLVHGDDLGGLESGLGACCSGQRALLDVELRIRAPEGGWQWVRTRGRVMERDAAGAPRRLVGTLTDISERKRNELAKRDSDLRLKLALEAASIGILEWQQLTGSAICDARAARLLGLGAERQPSSARLEQRFHADDRQRLRAAFVAAASRREGAALRVQARTVAAVDGPERWLELRGRVAAVGEGPLRIVATVIDISDLKAADEATRRVNAELERRVARRTDQLAAANRELEEFAYSVSHDLKAPLRGIDGYSRLLEEECGEALAGEARIFLRNIRAGAAQMHQLIGDLLEYSRLERRNMSPTALDLGEMVRAVTAQCSAEIGNAGVELRLEVPEISVHADRDGLAIALRNLVDNALKFSRAASPPVVEIGARREEGTAVLWVRDNGIGFEPRFHDRIFEIFQRLNLAEDYPGTGVGLALVRKAMRRLGGRVWAESQPGQGATFFLEIPT